MKLELTIGKMENPESKDGEQLTIYQNSIIKALYANSFQRTIHTGFTPENQQKIAEELGYRRALLDFLNYFVSQENT